MCLSYPTRRIRSIWVPEFLAASLKPHQVLGVQFVWKNLITLYDRQNSKGTGYVDTDFLSLDVSLPMPWFAKGLLIMSFQGLGKTLQTIVFVYTLFSALQNPVNSQIPRHLLDGRVLILCPKSVQNNWICEFEKWLPKDRREDLKIFCMTSDLNESQRSDMILDWVGRKSTILVMNYSMARYIFLVLIDKITVQERVEYFQNPFFRYKSFDLVFSFKADPDSITVMNAKS